MKNGVKGMLQEKEEPEKDINYMYMNSDQLMLLVPPVVKCTRAEGIISYTFINEMLNEASESLQE